MTRAKRSQANAAFTLIEILAALAIMSVFTTVTLTSMDSVVEDARFNQTVREMEQLRAALIGETQRLETGLRKNYGYLGDVGALPSTSQGLSALLSRPGAMQSWNSTLFNTEFVGTGWRGPYIRNTLDQNFLQDAWGNAYVYVNTGATSGTAATITSYGSDGSSGGAGYAQDIVINIPADVLRGKVLGYIVKPDGDVVGADQIPFDGNAQVVLKFADGNGAITTRTTTIAPIDLGRYQFSSVPLGLGAMMVYIPNIATATGSNIMGPTIVELNKTTTAAVPVASDAGAIYGTTSACATAEEYTVSNMLVDDTTNFTVSFTVSFATDYTFNQFYAEQGGSLAIQSMTMQSGGGTIMVKKDATGNFLASSSTGFGGAAIPANTLFNVTPNITLSAGMTHSFVIKYPSWPVSEVFYYQLGCKFFRFVREN